MVQRIFLEQGYAVEDETADYILFKRANTNTV